MVIRKGIKDLSAGAMEFHILITTTAIAKIPPRHNLTHHRVPILSREG